ncbi:MAG TPA: biotin--[acetyl-CoA-carboxylase] ligase [Candidatus Kryptonia bacterium]
MNYEIYRFDRIDSTNSYLMGLGEEGFPEGTVVLADEQSGGKGRFGRRWESEPLSNLLFSLLLRPDFLASDEIFILTFASALAVGGAIESIAQIKPAYKWPNDILIDSKKTSGILLESSFNAGKISFVVAGIGINVNQKQFPSEIAGRATSILLSSGKLCDRDELLFAVLNNFSSIYDTLRERDFYSIMKKWREGANMIGRKVTLKLVDRSIEGVCEEISDDGAIMISTPDGIRKFTAGEITIGGGIQ